VSLSADAPAVRAARAERLLELGRPEQARAQIALVLAAAPDDAAVHRLLVRCLLSLDDPGALAAATRAVTLAPEHEQGHRLASLACIKAGLDDQAVMHARKAVALAPHEWRAHHVLTRALTRPDPYAAYDAGLVGRQLAPHEPAMHLVVGLAALKSGRTDRAEDSFRKVLQLEPENAIARNNLAVVDLRSGRFGAAMDGFSSALTADPRLHLARGNLDAVVLTLLTKLRYIIVVSEFVAFQLIANEPGLDRAVAVALLASWAGLIGWGWTRIPHRLRRYSLGVFRRRRRAALYGAVLAVSAAGLLVGPVAGLVSTGAGLDLASFAALTILGDLVWSWRIRRAKSVAGSTAGR
jgi:Flp pilus assembly protein TadD